MKNAPCYFENGIYFYVTGIVKKVKSNIWIFSFMVFIFSCTDQNQEMKSELIADSNDSISEPKNIKFYDNHSTFRKWKDYYTSLDSNLLDNEFVLSSTTRSEFISGNIFGTFDKEFDKTYLPYLVYGIDREKYIDFDSYHWVLVDGQPQFEVDQEVNLVNIRDKTVLRIAFCGSQELVEDAYWMNDSTVVLLENLYGTRPQVQVIDLNTQTSKVYRSENTTELNSEYSKMRIIGGKHD